MIARPGYGKRKFGDHATGQQRTDWQYKLAQFLIGAGVLGRSQSEIVSFLINDVRADTIKAELEGLMAEEKVQKFELPAVGKGRPTTKWRATTKLLENDSG